MRVSSSKANACQEHKEFLKASRSASPRFNKPEIFKNYDLHVYISLFLNEKEHSIIKFLPSQCGGLVATSVTCVTSEKKTILDDCFYSIWKVSLQNPQQHLIQRLFFPPKIKSVLTLTYLTSLYLFSLFKFSLWNLLSKARFRQRWLTLFLNICCEFRRYFLSVSFGLTKNLHY